MHNKHSRYNKLFHEFFDETNDRCNFLLGESGNSYFYIDRSIGKILGRLSFLMDGIIIWKQTR